MDHETLHTIISRETFFTTMLAERNQQLIAALDQIKSLEKQLDEAKSSACYSGLS